VSGVQVPPPLPKNFNEIDLIYQSHLIYGEIRMRFATLICQIVCDQGYLAKAIALASWFNYEVQEPVALTLAAASGCHGRKLIQMHQDQHHHHGTSA
jgi:hypothetical protein